MARYDYTKLQNGSDIRGVALEGVAGETVNLTAEAASRLGRGFLFWLTNMTGKGAHELTVAIGRDPRLSGADIAKALIEGLLPHGCKVMDAGLASTPAMFMSTIFEEYKCDGAIMITASHLPWNRNGMKFFDANGGTFVYQCHCIMELMIFRYVRRGDENGRFAGSRDFA